MPERDYALSIKQPWAALLVHGLKTIEVRAWPTARRGRILIHAARVPDPGEYAWSLVPPQLREAASLVGGIVGVGQLTDCIAYRTPEVFAVDQPLHRNDPAWFRPPALYGFLFTDLKEMPFRAYPGWMRFFPVGEQLPARYQSSPQQRDLFP